MKNQSDSMLTTQSLWIMCQNSKFCIFKVQALIVTNNKLLEQICPVSILAGGLRCLPQPPTALLALYITDRFLPIQQLNEEYKQSFLIDFKFRQYCVKDLSQINPFMP